MNEDELIGVKCAFGAIVSPIYTQQETRSKKVPGRQELKASSPNWSIDQSQPVQWRYGFNQGFWLVLKIYDLIKSIGVLNQEDNAFNPFGYFRSLFPCE